ncbi:hypothetical protein DL93DRAFT_2072448 [Clavulina sp. PMI_390]|nr:hypothetical protein DL93DRAFT_2072448 [Clavulina sp. PMI_390]
MAFSSFYPPKAAEAEIKVYFNSDFGADYDAATWGAAVCEDNQAHVARARALGLKTISIANGLFLPFLRTPLMGVNGSEWQITDDGDARLAVADLYDTGRYTLRAAILAFQDPSGVPDRLRVYSDMKTL